MSAQGGFQEGPGRKSSPVASQAPEPLEALCLRACCSSCPHILPHQLFLLKLSLQNSNSRPSLVAQWVRIILTTQGIRVDPQSRKIPRAVGELSHNY